MSALVLDSKSTTNNETANSGPARFEDINFNDDAEDDWQPEDAVLVDHGPIDLSHDLDRERYLNSLTTIPMTKRQRIEQLSRSAPWTIFTGARSLTGAAVATAESVSERYAAEGVTGVVGSTVNTMRGFATVLWNRAMSPGVNWLTALNAQRLLRDTATRQAPQVPSRSALAAGDQEGQDTESEASSEEPIPLNEYETIHTSDLPRENKEPPALGGEEWDYDDDIEEAHAFRKARKRFSSSSTSS